jgi:hypothetical protein
MCVGRKFYKLHEAVEEYKEQGVSKRVSNTAIPEGLVPWRSKIFVAHPDAIVKVTAEGKTLADLAYTLLENGCLSEDDWDSLVEMANPYWTGKELHSEDFVPVSMLVIAIALSKMPEHEQDALKQELGLEFCMGIFGFAYLSGIEYVAKPGETDLPANMKHLKGYVQPVEVFYTTNTDEGEDSDE